MASASFGGAARLWNVATGDEMQALTGHGKQMTAMALSPDGKVAASSELESHVVWLWDVMAGKEKGKLEGHSIDCIAFSSHSKTVATVSRDKTVRLCDTTTGKENLMFKGQNGSFAASGLPADRTGHFLVHPWRLSRKSLNLATTGAHSPVKPRQTNVHPAYSVHMPILISHQPKS